MFNVTLMKTINPWVLSLCLQQCLKYVFLFLMLPPDDAEVEQILSETCCEDENHRQDNSSSHHRALLLSHGRNSNGLFWAEVNPSSHIQKFTCMTSYPSPECAKGTQQSPQPTQNFCVYSEFLSFFVLYSRLLADFLSHLGKWVKLIKFEAENEFFCTWKVEKPQSTTSTP